MKDVSILILIVLSFFLLNTKTVSAIYNPLDRENNFQGIHILFPEEIKEASLLVNSQDGDWGYVTIPIQYNDRNLDKWQKFMDEAAEYHIIPILRLSTGGDIFNTSVWRLPSEYDILDFANFLNSLDWPIENRYVIILNEVNRFDEWGGNPPSPERYSDILDYSIEIFKKRSENFFVIMAGLDNASPNDRILYMDNLIFIDEMIDYNESLFRRLDGIASHSYPNPGFSQPPSNSLVVSTSTYKFERQLISDRTGVELPIFITETGWDSDSIGETLAGEYFAQAYNQVWGKDKDKIVAITPFLLNSGEPFAKFSFIKNGKPSNLYGSVKGIQKVAGDPLIGNVVVGKNQQAEITLKKNFKRQEDKAIILLMLVTEYIKIFF